MKAHEIVGVCFSGRPEYIQADAYLDHIPYKPVNIGTNSFIGAGAIILPGSSIGEHCIIGAGAVVKGNIPDFSIVIGNPCKVIGDTRKNK